MRSARHAQLRSAWCLWAETSSSFQPFRGRQPPLFPDRQMTALLTTSMSRGSMSSLGLQTRSNATNAVSSSSANTTGSPEAVESRRRTGAIDRHRCAVLVPIRCPVSSAFAEQIQSSHGQGVASRQVRSQAALPAVLSATLRSQARRCCRADAIPQHILIL